MKESRYYVKSISNYHLGQTKDDNYMSCDRNIVIDATPDGHYAERILSYYLEQTKTVWATDTAGNCDNPLYQAMNEHQEKRRKELEKALEKLKE